MKKAIAVFVVCVTILLTGCSLLFNSSANKFDSDTDDMFEVILSAIDDRDSDTIKSLFSKGALARAKNIDDSIEYLFNLFDGEVVSWERGASSEGTSMKGNKLSSMSRIWYTVYTKNGKYLFLLLIYENNSLDPDLADGLFTLHAIDDANTDALWGSWQDMKFPGVYMPKE